ncbi:hypothetical protein GR160_11340 [Flavobacterium sp. Sd200]|uniref:hypothetical protein n=1 Tax=Flavobacterium sp. Sd200 TaxID=2692211 RepID=UPI00136D5890|nr:hypothetical protein [Flavobacterium sp. Sd200]MXN91820.1 hypothetical protein [Flavobacterium sp. Sd200]
MSFLHYSISLALWMLVLIGSGNATAQESAVFPVALSGNIESLSKNHVQEEVYIQTNKNIYETAEDLWFKGTVLNAQYLTPSQSAKTLYVSLMLLPEKKVVWQEKYAVVNGFTNGHIYINDTLQPGAYVLVAQTGRSVNVDDTFIRSVKKIEVIQNIFALEGREKIIEPAAVKPDSIDFQLLPEGGHLVAGISCKVAFKAVDSHGKPVDVKGTLYNGTKAMPGLTTFHAGMGSFYVTPEAGRDYFVRLDGYNKIYALPKVQSVGQTIQLLYEKDNLLAFKVSQSKSLPTQKMYFRMQSRGVINSMAEFELKQERLIKIKTDSLQQGIAEVTLFNANLEPVAERLVYVNSNKKIHLTTTLSKVDFGNKEKVTLKLLATDDRGKPVVSHLGVSVCDDIYTDLKNCENISTYYQLSTQLRGRVYNPKYYFDPANTNRSKALDLLMLTQGWRAYEWNADNLMSQNSKEKPFVSDSLTGTIIARKEKLEKLLGVQYVISYTADEDSEKSMLEVDEKGNYMIAPEYLQSKNRGYVYFRLLQDKQNISIRPISNMAEEKINTLLQQKQFDFPQMELEIKKTPQREERFKAARNITQLKEVVLTARVKKPRRFSDKYIGKLDSLAAPNDYVCQLNVLNCRNHPINGRKPVEGEIYKDPFTDMLMGPYRYPKYTEEELLAKFNITRLKGYYPIKEFYNPVYDGEFADIADDFRNTLLWKPDVITDSNGRAEVEFYTSDINSKFRVVAEGVTADGLLGSQITEFKVDKKELK